MKPYPLFFCFLFFPLLRLNAQQLEPAGFGRYTTAEGLSGNYITGLAQDATGYVWITTSSGLNRFSGSRFIQFHSTDDDRSPAAEELTNMRWLDAERLGIHTGAGLHIVNTRTGRTQNLFVPFHRRQYLYKFNVVHGARADANGNVYLLTRSGFYHFLNGNLVWRFDYYGEADLDSTHFHFGGELYDYDNRRLLLKTIGGLYLYHKAERRLQHLKGGEEPLLAGLGNPLQREWLFFQYKPGQLFALKPNTDSAFYLNTADGRKVLSRLPFVAKPEDILWRSRLYVESDTVLYLTGQSSGFYRLRFQPATGRLQMSPAKEFASFLCNALLSDKDRQLWVGTNKGLFRSNPQKRAVQYTPVPAGLLDTFVNLRLSDVYASGDLVYASARGDGGVLVFDKATLRYKTQLLLDKRVSSTNYVAAMAPAGGSLLLGGFRCPYLLDLKTHRMQPLMPAQWREDADWTNEVFRDRNGDVWISAGYNVYRYRPGAKRFELVPIKRPALTLPVFIREDKEGNIWMASHGIGRYNAGKQRFDWMVDSFPAIKMPDRQVGAFAFDENHTLWFNSNNNGLIGYDLVKKTYRQFTTRNGLPDNQIISVLPLGDKIWIACFSGMACLDLATDKVTSFGGEDGFPAMNVVGGSRMFYDSLSGQIYVPFSTALVRFHPSLLLQRQPPPKLFIQSLTISGDREYYLPAQSLHTSWKNTDLRITIGSINFSESQGQRFAYRIIKDAETPWIDLGSQPSFSMSGLSPGAHRIQVKAFSANNRWPVQTTELLLTVLPPWWREPWFLVIASAAVLAILYLFIKWRIALARRKEMVKTQIQRLKADDYKNQFELEQISHYFSSSLFGKKTEDDVLWDVAENLIGRMNYEDCIIYLWNEAKTRMVQKAAYGPKGRPDVIAADAFTVSPGQGVVGQVIETKKPVLVNDTRTDIRYRVDDEFRLSEVAVPILHNGELLGVIDSENSRLHYFSERDIKILSTIGTLIGNKLKQLESEQSLEAKQEELAVTNEQLAEAKLSALQAQMNPHFVFNALNSIKRMILDGDNDKASRYLSKFALMIRMTLEHSKETFVTLHSNIEYIKAYLEMERLRFGDSFSYEISVDEEIDANETTIPSMMIQPLVENAIWHGLLQSAGDKKIRIAFTEEDGRLECVVEDNGIGIHQSQKQKRESNSTHKSVGLDNLRKRIKIMNGKYDTGCSLSLVDLSDLDTNRHGTKVLLQLNLINV